MADSPCTGVCEIDSASKLCRGCGRTLDEIARWSVLDEREQQRVVLAARTRQGHRT